MKSKTKNILKTVVFLAIVVIGSIAFKDKILPMIGKIPFIGPKITEFVNNQNS